MTVTLYSWTPPTTHTSKYLLRPTVLNGPRDTPIWTREQRETYRRNRASGLDHDQAVVATQRSLVSALEAERTLDDIDDWYSPQIEDDGFLERLDRSAEIVRFP